MNNCFCIPIGEKTKIPSQYEQHLIFAFSRINYGKDGISEVYHLDGSYFEQHAHIAHRILIDLIPDDLTHLALLGIQVLEVKSPKFYAALKDALQNNKKSFEVLTFTQMV